MYQKIYILICLLFVNDQVLSQQQQQQQTAPQQHQQQQLQPINYQQIDLQSYPIQNSDVKYPLDDQDIDAYAKAQTFNEQESSNAVNYLSPDAVQQYVNSYSGQQPIIAGPTGPYSVQSGFEGFYVPIVPHQLPISPPPSPQTEIGTVVESSPISEIIFSVLRTVFPSADTFLSIFSRTGSVLLSLLGSIIFGGALTTAICTFTPLCTISFAGLALPFLRDTTIKDIRSLTGSLGAEITPERIKRASEFFNLAYEKYQKLQNTKETKNNAVNKNEKSLNVDRIKRTITLPEMFLEQIKNIQHGVKSKKKELDNNKVENSSIKSLDSATDRIKRSSELRQSSFKT